MIHSIVGQLKSGSLYKIITLIIFRSDRNAPQVPMTYINNGVAVNKPHHTWSWMARYTGLESGPFAFFKRHAFRLAHKQWWLFWFGIFIRLLRNTNLHNNKKPTNCLNLVQCNALKYFKDTYTCHDASIARILSMLFM